MKLQKLTEIQGSIKTAFSETSSSVRNSYRRLIFCEVVDLESQLSGRWVSQADVYIAEYRHGIWSQELFPELPLTSYRTLGQLPNLSEA